MAVSTKASDILDDEFLRIRANLLELSARLDRVERGEGSVQTDPRARQIRDALALLQPSSAGDRTAQVQMVFSLPYDETWRAKFEV